MAASIPHEMLTCQVVEINEPYRIRRIPTPNPSSLPPHGILVAVAVASLCHTDLMVIAGEFRSKLPITGSHEGAGTVVAMGPLVTGWEVGDRVMCGVTSYRCGKCAECTGPESQSQYCTKSLAPGIQRDGAFADYMIADARESQKLPETISFEDAAPLACAGRTVYRSIIQANLTPGQWLGLVGSGGGLGHLGVQFGKAFGLKVLGIDARPEGLALSSEMGADATLDARPGKGAVVRQVMQLTEGQGCEATVNVSDAEGAAALAAAITKKHGRVIQVAQPTEVCIPFLEFIFRDIKIEGSMIASAKQSEEMLEMVARNRIKVKTNAFHGLAQVAPAVELLKAGKIQGKGIVIVDEEAVQKQRKRSVL